MIQGSIWPNRLAMSLVAALVSGAPALADLSWTGGQMRFIVGSSAGGGFDTTARQLQPHFAERLGVSMAVENHAAGSGAVGARIAIADDSCRTIMMWGIPHLAFSYMTQQVDYTYEDFAPLGQISVDAGVIRVHNDAPWQTLQDLVDDARARPGEIIVSAGSFQDAYFLGVKQLEEAAGVEFNIVPFGGGAEARNALAGGHVDMNYAGVFNSLPVAEHTRVLAVVAPENRWMSLTNDAPTANEALDGVTLPPQGPSYGIFTSAGCRERHPERFAVLKSMVADTLRDPAYLGRLEQLGEADRLAFMTAEDYDAMIRDALPGLAAFAAAMN